ncbi:four-carbon acid sugar kinase family protein [uncultured Alsobacter sp.]|uniref:four-carbon acid sugar kinase family protein n=1 Tax=uncultured Alsobacter sp. TaxID=1748258 RepID=UPI0025F023D4|nr:four-carbon acid sugar kinase family protein [uncultured Alsobacter sp.]
MTDALALPGGLLLAFYGDDFTGSTDTMEVMAFAGLPIVLFLEDPTPERMARFPDARAVGIAGVSRSRDPAWMEANLPGRFEALARLGAPVLQYKVCSTFDSAPHVGSIGKAVDLGVQHAPGRFTPMVVGAPRLRRFQAFGNLFATLDDVGYRLDRHPTMARHPVTPMGEADLAIHLSRQTQRRIELVHLVQLKQGRGADRLAGLAGDDVPVVLIDVLDDETLAEAGRLVWENRGEGLFTASSSGLQYALVAYWRGCGALAPETAARPASAVDRIAVVSGSCSPATQAQIGWASEHGFDAIRLDAAAAVSGDVEREADRCTGLALAALGQGRDPLVFSALGPADPSLATVAAAAERTGLDPAAANRRIGQALASVMRTLLERTGLTRVAVAGGDTSGDVASSLGLMALTALAPLAPGSPLCAAWSDDPSRPPLEVALKGGQVGSASFFGAVKAGAPLT